jgi:hypothetical protein
MKFSNVNLHTFLNLTEAMTIKLTQKLSNVAQGQLPRPVIITAQHLPS